MKFGAVKKIVLCRNNKPHMISKLRTAFMIRSRLKNKANKRDKVANKIAYKKQITLDVKLNKEPKHLS